MPLHVPAATPEVSPGSLLWRRPKEVHLSRLELVHGTFVLGVFGSKEAHGLVFGIDGLAINAHGLELRVSGLRIQV